MFNFITIYNKIHNYKLQTKKKKLKNLAFGTLGLQSLNYGIIRPNNIKSIKRITLRVIKPFKGKI
jgi:hypothetical protein